jgi:hypothetical protein
MVWEPNAFLIRPPVEILHDALIKILFWSSWKTFYGFSRDFSCKLFAVNCFELEDPGTVFDLIKVV